MHPFIDLFGFQLGTYGVAIALGVGATYFLTTFLGKRSPIGEDNATTLLVAAIFGAFGGAKLLAVLVEGSVDLRSGGVYLGGFIGVVISALIVVKWKRLPLAASLDLMTPVGTIGHFFGRIGCLLAGCCYGRPTDGALALQFPKGSGAYQALVHNNPALIHGEHTVGLVPTQLYEALFELGLTGLFVTMLLRKARPGLTFSLYFIGYAVFRFIIEYWRFDPERGYAIQGVLSTSQFISLIIFAAGCFGLWRALRPGSAAKS